MSASTDWKLVRAGILSKTTSSGVVVVKSETQSCSPLFCPTCNRLVKTQLDAQEFQTYQCCYYCSLKWAQPNHKKWLEGWRPSQEEVSKEVEERNQRNLVISYKPILFK